MSLTDSWTETAISGPSQSTTVPRAIPAGSLLVASVTRGGTTVVTGGSVTRGNTWVVHGTSAHTSGSLTVSLATMVVTTALQAGDVLTLTSSGTTSRCALAFGVFNDLLLPIGSPAVSAAVSSAATPVSAGPTPAMPTPRALVLTAAGTTEAGYPISGFGNKVAVQVLTPTTSNNRGAALLYKSEGGEQHTGSYALAGSVISASLSVAFKANDLPPGTVPVMTADGEVSGVLSVWTGSAEVPVGALGVS